MVASKHAGRATRLRPLQSTAASPSASPTGSPLASLRLIQGSLSGRGASHRRPWLNGLHRTADGTLAGLGLCMLALSGLTLHWQNQWALSYHKLEAAQVLEHRFQESAAQLERNHLATAGRPGQLVPTSSDKLIFVASPPSRSAAGDDPLASLNWRKAAAGY